MAYGRTPKSLVAICVDPSGDLEYRGVRLSDNAALELSASRGSDGTVIEVLRMVTFVMALPLPASTPFPPAAPRVRRMVVRLRRTR